MVIVIKVAVEAAVQVAVVSPVDCGTTVVSLYPSPHPGPLTSTSAVSPAAPLRRV